jgi:Rad3-related DNA helicase
MDMDQVIDIVGIVLGLIFLALSLRASRSLVGSAFKRYHYWMMVGATLVSLSFVANMIGEVIGQEETLETVHHIIMLISIVIFIITDLQLPKEAGRYLNLPKNEKEKSD